MRRLRLLLMVAGLTAALSCAYYNTFYNAEVLYRDGVKLVDAGNASQARSKFDAAIKKSASVIKSYPKSQWVDDALFLVAMSYFHTGDFTKAIIKFDNFEAVFPNSPRRDEARLYHARALIEDRQFAKGVGMLKALKEDSPKFQEDAALQLASILYKQEDYAGAIKAFREFEADNPKSTKRRDVRRLLAETYFQLGQYDSAARAYREHKALTEHTRQRMGDDLKIAECYLLDGRPDSTLAIMRRQPDRFADYNDRIHLLTGKALQEKGNREEAYEAFTKVRTGTDASEAYYRVGRMFEQDTNFVRAQAYYDTARQRDASSPHARQAGQRSLLIGKMLQGLKGASDTAEVHFLMAEVYHLNLEQDSVALPRYQRVADSFPKSEYAPKALYAVAWLKQNRLKQSDSLLAYEAVVTRYPKTIYAQEARKALGLPLLPDDQIVKPVEKKDTAKKVGMTPGDSLLARGGRPDSLGMPDEEGRARGPGGERGGRRRDRSERREKGDRPRPPSTGTPSTSPGADEPPVTTPPLTEPGPKPVEPAPDSMEGPMLPKPGEPVPGPDTAVVPAVKTDTLPAAPRIESLPVRLDTVPKEPEVATPPVRLDTQPKPDIAVSPMPQETVPAPAKDTVVPPPVRKTPPVEYQGMFRRDTGLKPVYFEFDRAGLRASDTLVLLANLKYLQALSDVEVLVTGYCDPVGDEDYNEALGLRRAVAVQKWLIAHGFDPGRIRTASAGRSDAVYDEPEYYWLERRAEFRVSTSR